ncbi:MAG TPA: TetR/AcrR family transcriptional regulator [Polyangiaceae bacterium]|jgi:AcrR family transcriptional regulator|nr:MAG: regulatory protein [Deltaproteobacteria bacterium ADurb.Bin207]HNS96150.1 TetR/AcrR family transcriptional regulator [Polyangiaceae bacterium]HNZ22236.1 TetR/AcrR family transcriptional regulator [Polyangiaceae bacterium]HOD22248.1 TetR/AcrR family transcriptional regulator [Polyangiaceae bacterium]HOE47060.1 TetR/AcrR family transcriptional regulator [Polyangiaceae bacterium]
MTKHRTRDEWVAEILDAAAGRIVAEGYSNLTMESIAAHTSLSKGGVYRYFRNKRDVALALFERVYNNSMDFDYDDIVGWNLSIAETIQRLLVVRRNAEQLRQDHVIWVQLIPETLWDEGFKQHRTRLFEALRGKFEELVRRIVARDGLVIHPESESRFQHYVYYGLVLREGMTFHSVMGLPLEEQGEMYRQFIELFVKDVFAGQVPTSRS